MNDAATVRLALASRNLPNGGGSWLSIVRDEADRAKLPHDDVLTSRRKAPSAARQRAWARLYQAIQSYPRVAEPWGANHTVIMDAVRIVNGWPRRKSGQARPKPTPRGHVA